MSIFEGSESIFLGQNKVRNTPKAAQNERQRYVLNPMMSIFFKGFGIFLATKPHPRVVKDSIREVNLGKYRLI